MQSEDTTSKEWPILSRYGRGHSREPWEEIDSATTFEEAKRLRIEYKLAFGPDFAIQIGTVRTIKG